MHTWIYMNLVNVAVTMAARSVPGAGAEPELHETRPVLLAIMGPTPLKLLQAETLDTQVPTEFWHIEQP